MMNLFPMDGAVGSSEVEIISNEVGFGRSLRFDYRLGEFVLTPTGKVAVSEGTDAWLEWCKKAVMTNRYTFLAYSRNYGQEYETLIGQSLPRGAIESEIKRLTMECLMADPRTKSVQDFSFQWESDRIAFTCTVKNVRDESGIIQGSVVNM